VRAENGICWLTDSSRIVTHPAMQTSFRTPSTSRESLASRRCHPRTSVLCVPRVLGVYNRFQTPSAQCAQRTAFVGYRIRPVSSPIRRCRRRSAPPRRRANLSPRDAATPRTSVLCVPGVLCVYNRFQRRARSARRERHLLLTDWSRIVTHPATRKSFRTLDVARTSPAPRRCHPRTSVLCVPGVLGVLQRISKARELEVHSQILGRGRTSTLPGFSPVRLPSLSTTTPLITTWSTPVANRCGSSYVA
jgi:hypothetical protein